MNTRIFIIGAQTGFITEAIEICESAGYTEIFCVDNLETMKETSIAGYPVVYLTQWETRESDRYICCIHTPLFRKKIIDSMNDLHVQPTSVIHSSAIVSKRATISSAGVIIGAGAVIGANTTINNFVLINRGALIGHDISIGSYATVEAGTAVGGNSTLEELSYIGMNASILPTKRIGKHSVVGAGSVVLRDVADNTFVAGNPAEIKKENISGYQGTNKPII